MVSTLILSIGQSYKNQYLLKLLLKPDFGLYKNLGSDTLGNNPHAMKPSTTHDPDTSCLYETMSGEHREDLLTAIGKDISELEQMNTWKIVKKNSLPRGANLLPSTWDFKINRYPDGRMRKHKARFCVKGDCQIQNLGYVESYASFVSRLTILIVMNIADQRGCTTQQVDLSNDFIQAILKVEVYVEMPAMFSEKKTNSEETVVIKLSKYIYILVQAPCTWYQHLQKGLKGLKFYPPNLENAMYYKLEMIVITYVGDCLFFGPDMKDIQKAIKKLEENE